MFIGRQQEMSFLEDRYNSPRAQLLVLYGRRRIGKTEVLHQFCNGKDAVFYTCRELIDADQLKSFSKRILQAGSPASRYITTFSDWEAALTGFAELPSNGVKKLLVIDEFPYMCVKNPSIPSILQVLWDELLKKQNLMIVLSGSAMSFIENEILSEKKPLYGRATGIYKMQELTFEDSMKFFPNYSPEDKMLAYSILGGIPHYLNQFEPTLSLRENIIKNVLTKGSVLYSEVEFMLRQELRETSVYNTIIEAVVLGNTQLNDIYMKTQIDKSKISVYLSNLMQLHIIEREFSVLGREKEQATSTRGIYYIKDHFFRFWYRFVSSYLSDLELGDAEAVFTHSIFPLFNDFVSPVFEMVCREFLSKKSRDNQLPFRISKIGRWWGKLTKMDLIEGKRKKITQESEIDMVAVDANSTQYFLGECKFRNSIMGISDLKKLQEKSSFIKTDAMIHYALFSKSGFTEELIELGKTEGNLILYTLAEMLDWDKLSL
jgi:AAA+ ATPase superfamily predicted ATPase